MVLKTRSDSPVKLIKDTTKFSTWKVPELDFGKAPSFRQPVEEEENIDEEQQEQLKTEALKTIKDSAYQEGFQSGKKEAFEVTKIEIDQQINSLTNIIHQLTEPLSQCKKQTEEQLLQLSFAIARQIIRRELQQDPTQLIAIIREALKLLPIGSQNIAITLHPEDASIVKEALSIDEQNESANWQITSDPSVERGGCQVNTKNSKVDASIDKQIAVLFSRVAGGQRSGESDAN